MFNDIFNDESIQKMTFYYVKYVRYVNDRKMNHKKLALK